MDEIVVRVARAIACAARLDILSHLADVGETIPSDMARELSLAENVISTHLRVLTTTGLITRRRSGAKCYCQFDSPYEPQTLSGQIVSWLKPVLGHPRRALKNCRLREVRNSSDSEARARLHEVVFDAFTAFTNVRRIQILRRLFRGDAVTVEAMTRELGMSDAAVSRHTSKLVRRGFVARERLGSNAVFRLAAKHGSPIHSKAFDIVKSQWPSAD